MPHYRKLVGEKCYLSPCSPEDAAYWAKWENDLAVAIPLGDEAYTPMTLEKALQFIREDEMVEGTPRSIRLRKAVLSAGKRHDQGIARKKAAG